MNGKVRKGYIDIAKGIGILLIILGHLKIDPILKNVIYSFHVPLFFFVSGMFYNAKSKLKDRFWSNSKLILHYFLFGLVFFLIRSVLDNDWNIKDFIKNILLATPESLYDIPWFYSFWFLPVIFFLKVFSDLLRQNLAIALILSISTFYCNQYFPFESLPWCIGITLFIQPFYILGAHYKFIEDFCKKKHALLFTLSLFIIGVSSSLLFFDGSTEKIVNYGNLYVYNYPLAFLNSFLGIITIVALTKKFEIIASQQAGSGISVRLLSVIDNFFVFFGKNSLIVFEFHLFLITLSYIIYRFIFKIDPPTFIQLLFVVGASSIIILLINGFKKQKRN